MLESVEEIPLGELPEIVIAAAARDLANHSIGFLRIDSTPRREDAVLLGSGTLVSVGSIRSVLTAHHVVTILPKTGRLGLIMEPTIQRHTVDTQGLRYLEIARGAVDADGPDLGAVILAPTIASAIAAKKTFYNLDLHRDQLLHSPLGLREGFWFVNGFIAEKTVEERRRDGYDLVKEFHNQSGAGGPEEAVIVGEHDYFSFPVTYGGRSIAPRSFGGMSGGGLWQVPLVRDAQGELHHQMPLLSGVVFYQEQISETSCHIKCHGRRSVYQVAYEAIQNAKP